MNQFNAKLAPYIEEKILENIYREFQKPQSLRYVARKFNLTVYGVKRLIDYYELLQRKSQN